MPLPNQMVALYHFAAQKLALLVSSTCCLNSRSVIDVVVEIAKNGQEIPAGTMILSGGITEAVPVMPGDSVTLKIQHLGSTSIRFS